MLNSAYKLRIQRLERIFFFGLQSNRYKSEGSYRMREAVENDANEI